MLARAGTAGDPVHRDRMEMDPGLFTRVNPKTTNACLKPSRNVREHPRSFESEALDGGGEEVRESCSR